MPEIHVTLLGQFAVTVGHGHGDVRDGRDGS
jgi:hypothetical protein